MHPLSYLARGLYLCNEFRGFLTRHTKVVTGRRKLHQTELRVGGIAPPPLPDRPLGLLFLAFKNHTV